MVSTVRLGGTASNIEVAKISHGLMRMTWAPKPVPDEQAFKAIKDGVDAAGGAKVYLNSADFYGPNLSTANLELLARFYERYPEYKDRTVLCVKGAVDSNFKALCTEENLRRTLDVINETLRGTKRLDVFECARVDLIRPIEATMTILKQLVAEGKMDHIGISECNAETLRRANAVHPLASVEIEVSPLAYEVETQKVIATAAELKIPVLAYSPQGWGALTGRIRSSSDIDPDDIRKHFDRFQPENLHHNIKLVDGLTKISQRRGVTPGQLSIAWVASLGRHMIPLPGSAQPTHTIENLMAGDIVLTAEECAEILKVIETNPVKGDRYWKGTPGLWG